jgi:hypothetical protein
MNDAQVSEALLELKERGWPLSIHKGNPYVVLEWPDGNNFGTYLDMDWQRDRAMVKAWLEACLEARGLRRDIEWEYFEDGWCCVLTVRGEGIEEQTLDHPTELEALIAACLALSAEAP